MFWSRSIAIVNIIEQNSKACITGEPVVQAFYFQIQNRFGINRNKNRNK